LFILDGGILPGTRHQIQETAQQYAHLQGIEFIQIDIERFAHFPNLMHFSLNTYFRYLIPELKPELQKVLYIDSDMVITADVGKLFDTDMQGAPLAAVPYRDERPDLNHFVRAQKGQHIKQILGLPDTHLYFNAGLLMLDCEYFRQHGWVNKLFELTSQLAETIKYPDQDILNIIVCNNYHVLDDTWNAVIDIDKMYGVQHTELPKVLHFTGGAGTRPWLSLTCPYREEFDKYASKTPFANELFTKRLEFEILVQKQVLARLIEAEYARKRAPLHRIWMRLTGRRKQNQQEYALWAKLRRALNIENDN
jgi:lipopolysaccharide biosynthesis glycosyltransferase